MDERYDLEEMRGYWAEQARSRFSCITGQISGTIEYCGRDPARFGELTNSQVNSGFSRLRSLEYAQIKRTGAE